MGWRVGVRSLDRRVCGLSHRVGAASLSAHTCTPVVRVCGVRIHTRRGGRVCSPRAACARTLGCACASARTAHMRPRGAHAMPPGVGTYVHPGRANVRSPGGTYASPGAGRTHAPTFPGEHACSPNRTQAAPGVRVHAAGTPQGCGRTPRGSHTCTPRCDNSPARAYVSPRARFREPHGRCWIGWVVGLVVHWGWWVGGCRVGWSVG